MRRRAQIFNEIDPLEEVLVWGEPGCEALLGQLLPKSKSLFRSYYEVPEARHEFQRMQALIEGEGIRVIHAKDAMARWLTKHEIPGIPSTLHELQHELLLRAESFFKQYHHDKDVELQHEGIPLHAEDVFEEVKSDLPIILAEDVERYGEIPAMQINHLLSLSKPYPMSNIFYGRDQSQVIADQVILSSLKWHIRKPEVLIYKDALAELGFEAVHEIHDGTIEGGDLSVFEGACYIGVGARTSLPAVKDVRRKIGPVLDEHGIDLIAVINRRHVEEADFFMSPTDEHMQVMHLDMFWIPLAPKLIMAYGAELDQRSVIKITQKGDTISAEELGTFRDHLSDRGIEIIDVSAAEQKNFATNLLHLGGNKILAALSTNPRINDELQRRGFDVLFAELTKLVDGYGAVHCLTAPVRRTPSP